MLLRGHWADGIVSAEQQLCCRRMTVVVNRKFSSSLCISNILGLTHLLLGL